MDIERVVHADHRILRPTRPRSRDLEVQELRERELRGTLSQEADDLRELDVGILLREEIQKVVDHMMEQRFGRIVNITSMSVKMPVPGLDLSSGARAGLTAFLAGVARTVADRNVTINNILPGYLDTDRLCGGLAAWAKNAGVPEDEVAAQRAAQVPANRFGSPVEFGKTCAFLCSQHAGYITGQSILLDGGLYNSAF